MHLQHRKRGQDLPTVPSGDEHRVELNHGLKHGRRGVDTPRACVVVHGVPSVGAGGRGGGRGEGGPSPCASCAGVGCHVPWPRPPTRPHPRTPNHQVAPHSPHRHVHGKACQQLGVGAEGGQVPTGPVLRPPQSPQSISQEVVWTPRALGHPRPSTPTPSAASSPRGAPYQVGKLHGVGSKHCQVTDVVLGRVPGPKREAPVCELVPTLQSQPRPGTHPQGAWGWLGFMGRGGSRATPPHTGSMASPTV